MVSNPGPLDWESSALLTKQLLLNMNECHRTSVHQQTCCLEQGQHLKFDCSEIRTHNHLFCEQTLNHLLDYFDQFG